MHNRKRNSSKQLNLLVPGTTYNATNNEPKSSRLGKTIDFSKKLNKNNSSSRLLKSKVYKTTHVREKYSDMLKREQTLKSKITNDDKKHFKEVLDLSSAINILQDKILEAKANRIPYVKWEHIDGCAPTAANIEKYNSQITIDDQEYLNLITQMIRGNRKMFTEEYMKRFERHKAKFTKPKIVLSDEDEFDINDPKSVLQHNRKLLNYNYIVSEVARKIDCHNTDLTRKNDLLNSKISAGGEIELLCEDLYMKAKEEHDQLKEKIEKAKLKAKDEYDKAMGNYFCLCLASEQELKDRLEEFKEINEQKAKKKLDKVIKRYNKPPMSAREVIKREPVIRIYPDYNPKFSRNQMRPMTIKAWETARTMATTPITSERVPCAQNDPGDGFSRNSEIITSPGPKPRTAAFPRRKGLKKCRTVTKLNLNIRSQTQSTFRKISQAKVKSRNNNFMKDFQSLFSSNCKSQGTMNAKQAKKFEKKIMRLKNKIQEVQDTKKEAVLNLTNSRKHRYDRKIFLENILAGIQDAKDQLLQEQRKILLGYGFKRDEEFSYKDLEEKQAEQLSEKIKQSNDKVLAIQSKERVIKLLLEKSGLSKTDKQ
ncbi:unnamed protein product [Moneuplotes crassus]|uniref:Uncharacterized protein n=1 Tax=Euplotes crassus TaxID=5936 RepID=A0AAD1U416_EUPCR|nr:unnamed protein product [Moneuplotes crassus]